MTVASQVKQCLASLKSIEASLNTFALQAENEEAKEVFHQNCLKTRKVIAQIEARVSKIELEEPQYKGF
ncbi:MAG: DUF1657 domain-containing protein [Bacillaceae bacterium]|nr:DUF1657 domain-containing protein [Bacillaceae bacterium]